MSINLEVVRETIKERKHDMVNNRALTNELAIDDLMISLGYNKKRDTSVLRQYQDKVDWKVVYPTGSRLAVRTFPVGEEVKVDAVQDTFDMALAEDTAVVLLTNGEDIKIFAINNIESKYVLINELNIHDELDNLTSKVLVSISKSGFDRAILNDIVMSKYITTDKVKEWLNKYETDIVKLIIGNEKLTDTSRLSPLYCEIINNNNTVVEEVSNIEELEAMKANLDNILAEKESLENNFKTILEEKDTIEKEKLAIEDKLKSAIEEKDKIEEAKSTIENNINSLEAENTSIKEENITLKEENSNVKDENAKLIEENTSIKEENSKLTEENSTLKEKVESFENCGISKEEFDNMKNMYDDAMGQLSGLTVQNKSLISQIEKLQETISSKDNEIANINNSKEELKVEIENLRGEVNKLNTLSIDDYIQQIHDLTEQCNCIAEERDILAAKVKKLQEDINDLEGIDKKKAQELLDVIQVDDNSPRQYVGVINTELFQYPELSKFVGCVLQKLSELKGHLAASYIFDGDMFILVPNGDRKDLMINNKYFDIDLSNMGEAEAINKLRIIFSHFDDLIFDCKLVGKLADDTDDIEYTLDQNINRDVNADLEVEEKRFKISLFKKPEEGTVEEAEQYNEQEYIEQEQTYEEPAYIEPQNYLMVVQLQSYFDMFMREPEDGTIEYTGIKYIGTNSCTYRINDSEDLDRQLVKCIDSILAIESSRGRSTIIKEFKQCDLRNISDVILKYDTTTKDYPKITAAKYCINGVKDVVQLVKVLYDICEQMQIDMSDIFIYANGLTNAFSLTDIYGYDEANVILYDNLDCTVNDDGSESAAVLKGDIFNNIIFTHNSLNVHSQLIKMAVGVKTKYMAQTIASYDDFVNNVKLLVTNALNNHIDKSIISRCTTLDGKYKLVSIDETQVSANHREIETNGEIFYISFIENWEIAESLLRIHTDIYNDTAIAIKVILRNNILNFINSDFYTSEPSLALAIYSFRNYINGAVK